MAGRRAAFLCFSHFLELFFQGSDRESKAVVTDAGAANISVVGTEVDPG